MNNLEKIFNTKINENGDISYKSTSNNLLDILFMTSFFEKHLEEVRIGTSDREKLFAMFIRDPRFGLGRRDLGRVLAKQTELAPADIVASGRFDDLFFIASDACIELLYQECRKGNELAKKWMPRLNSKNKHIAKALCKEWKINQKDYRKLIKCDSTVEYKLSYVEAADKQHVHPLVDNIKFEHVPSLAMIKYFKRFLFGEDTSERFKKYLEAVKEGTKKLNIATTNVYDIYKNRDKIDADLFFDKIEKIDINCIVILDTSGSMYDSNDSIGKAMSIGHYLAKCTNYCKDHVISFSSRPKLIKIQEQDRTIDTGYYGRTNPTYFGSNNKYSKELNSLYTGDHTNTDFAKVMDILKELNEFPEYIVVLSDMEFDRGSNTSKNELEQLWKKHNCPTKIVWWNFNTRNKTVPEVDTYGNIYISGYSPQMLQYLEAGFDGDKYLEKLLLEYSNRVESIRK